MASTTDKVQNFFKTNWGYFTAGAAAVVVIIIIYRAMYKTKSGARNFVYTGANTLGVIDSDQFALGIPSRPVSVPRMIKDNSRKARFDPNVTAVPNYNTARNVLQDEADARKAALVMDAACTVRPSDGVVLERQMMAARGLSAPADEF